MARMPTGNEPRLFHPHASGLGNRYWHHISCVLAVVLSVNVSGIHDVFLFCSQNFRSEFLSTLMWESDGKFIGSAAAREKVHLASRRLHKNGFSGVCVCACVCAQVYEAFVS